MNVKFLVQGVFPDGTPIPAEDFNFGDAIEFKWYEGYAEPQLWVLRGGEKISGRTFGPPNTVRISLVPVEEILGVCNTAGAARHFSPHTPDATCRNWNPVQKADGQ